MTRRNLYACPLLQHHVVPTMLWILAICSSLVVISAATAGATEIANENGCTLLGQRLAHVHPLWLRERCRESFYVDLQTRQPKMNLHEYYDPNLHIMQVNTTTTATKANDDDKCAYQVTFSDGHTCLYPGEMMAAELDHQDYFLQVPEWKLPVVKLWNHSTLPTLPQFHHDHLVQESTAMDPSDTDKEETLAFLETLITTGLVLVTHVPAVAGECIRFGTHFSTLHATEWGDLFNVRSQPDQQGGTGSAVRQDLAYSSHPIGMHVDNPYRVDNPPAFQLLHALEHCTAATGPCQVHNQFVDGFAVAHDLCRKHRPLFDILTSTVLRWENNGGDDTSLLYRYAPMIEVAAEAANSDACPPIQAINFSAKSGGYAPFMEHLELFYQAKHLFSSWLHSPEYTVSVQLFPGALVMFDNRRVLHSRSTIAPTDGARWLQGCYLHRDGILYQYERRRRQSQQRAWSSSNDNKDNCEGAKY